MLCPNCETENREEAKFCDQCGFPLTSNAGTQQSQNEDEQPDQSLQTQDSQDERVLVSFDEAQEGQAVEGDVTQVLDGEAKKEPEASEDETQVIEYDLAGFDRHSDEFTERVLDSSYPLPVAENRDGGTMQMPRVEGEAAQKSRDYLASSTTKRKGAGKKVALGVVAVLIVAAAVALGTYAAGIWGGKQVPDVVGYTEADAKSILMDQGFEVRVEQVKSDDTEGLVLIMDPQANSRIEEGSEVVIHVASARTIPDVKGKTKNEAVKLLAEEGYENVKTVKESSEKKEGTVIAVKPKVGSRAASSTEIKLTVAQPYTVPDIANMEFNAAVEKLQKADLNYEVVYISTDSYPEGTIIGTEPAAGSVVSKGAYIVIQISQAWGSQLEEIVQGYLAPGTSIDINGTSYTVESLDSVAYIGNNTVSYTVTARPYTYFFGELLSASSQTISGTAVFDDDGDLVSLS